jgi:heme a synthase
MTAGQGILYTTALIDRERRNRALVRWWLYFICLLVFAMVIVGGATRLTDSGLSITEWKPIHGIIPPLTHAQWMEEFDKYRLIPEYELVNKGMSLLQFQFIYWWEWAHRFLGRIVGIVFFVPLVYFWATGKLENRLKPRLVLLLALGGLQGFIGWWMVSSGLTERVDVSQYRLAVHLTLACIIFAYAMWVARGLAPHSADDAPPALAVLAPAVVLFTLLQIFLGALVAGLDAGLAYNDWPTMDGRLIPEGLFQLEPVWRNFFENIMTVQFVHRMSAYFLVTLIFVQWLVSRAPSVPAPHRLRALILLWLALGQASLGILTLVLMVPLPLALAHQAGAAILLGFAVAHWRAIHGTYAPLTGIEVRS